MGKTILDLDDRGTITGTDYYVTADVSSTLYPGKAFKNTVTALASFAIGTGQYGTFGGVDIHPISEWSDFTILDVRVTGGKDYVLMVAAGGVDSRLFEIGSLVRFQNYPDRKFTVVQKATGNSFYCVPGYPSDFNDNAQTKKPALAVSKESMDRASLFINEEISGVTSKFATNELKVKTFSAFDPYGALDASDKFVLFNAPVKLPGLSVSSTTSYSVEDEYIKCDKMEVDTIKCHQQISASRIETTAGENSIELASGGRVKTTRMGAAKVISSGVVPAAISYIGAWSTSRLYFHSLVYQTGDVKFDVGTHLLETYSPGIYMVTCQWNMYSFDSTFEDGEYLYFTLEDGTGNVYRKIVGKERFYLYSDYGSQVITVRIQMTVKIADENVFPRKLGFRLHNARNNRTAIRSTTEEFTYCTIAQLIAF